MYFLKKLNFKQTLFICNPDTDTHDTRVFIR